MKEVPQTRQATEAFIFEGTEEDKLKKIRKDLFEVCEEKAPRRPHFQTALFTPFPDCRSQREQLDEMDDYQFMATFIIDRQLEHYQQITPRQINEIFAWADARRREDAANRTAV